MKKHIVLLVSAILISNMVDAQQAAYILNKNSPGDTSVEQTHDTVTLQMLNCKPGVYRTYEDFVKGNAEDLKWMSFDCGASFSSLPKFDVVFKDKSGKKVKIPAAEFWGWRNEDGTLWRNGQYINGKLTAIPFFVEYVADYVMYHPQYLTGLQTGPYNWSSIDLKSPILESDYFFKRYKTSVAKVVKWQSDCSKKTNAVFNPKFYNQLEACLIKCPSIRFLFVKEKGMGVKGNYRKAD